MVDTLHPPLSVIATWPKPNYIDPDTRGQGLVYICIIFAAIGIIIGIARVYSRLFITKALGLDDLLAVVAIGFLTALISLVIVGNKDFYSGRHVWDIPPDSFVGGRANIWASLWCYVIGITLIKISVLLFYRRLSVKFSRTFLIATWIGIIYNVLYFVSFGFTLLLLCRPLHAYWDSFDPVWAATHKFHCASERAALPASSALSVAGDFYSTLLPLILVYHLANIPRRQKLALYALFALGFVAAGAGVVRTVLMYKLLNVDWDFTWELWLTWVWAVVELYLALFAASAPSLKPFFRHFFVESVNSFRGSKHRQQAHGEVVSQEAVKAAGKAHPTETRERQIAVGQTADIERDGNGHTDRLPVSQQGWYQSDAEQPGTPRFEMQVSPDGRGMIPMRTYSKVNNRHSTSTAATGGGSTPYEEVLRRQSPHPQSSSQRPPTPPPKESSSHDWPLTALTTEMLHHEPREFLASSRHTSYTNP